MRPLVILRPEPGASATATAAESLGLRPIVMPLFAVEAVEWSAPDPRHYDGLLLTSANAVRHAGPQLERLRTLPGYCVGEATAAAAREAGLSVALTGNGRVDPLLASMPGNMRLLHLCGVHRREPSAPSQSIEVLPVYQAIEKPAPPEIARIEGSVVAVHSPRAGARLAQLAGECRLDRDAVAIAAISDEAAAAAGCGWRTVEASAEPTDTALLALALRLCQNR